MQLTVASARLRKDEVEVINELWLPPCLVISSLPLPHCPTATISDHFCFCSGSRIGLNTGPYSDGMAAGFAGDFTRWRLLGSGVGGSSSKSFRMVCRPRMIGPTGGTYNGSADKNDAQTISSSWQSNSNDDNVIE